MARAPLTFRTIQRAAFDDLDPFGHMNTSSYVAAFLDHRFTGLREVLGLDLAALAQLPFILVTRRLGVEFVKSIQGDEAFEIVSRVSAVGDGDCQICGEMHNGRGQLAATFQLSIACVSKETRRSSKWSPGFMDRFFAADTVLSSSDGQSGVPDV
jgi:acyl-CoA thioesterase FadM